MSAQFIINAALKGVVQGFAEFLPISSTGHLILLDKFLPLSSGSPEEIDKLNKFFDVVMLLPAIMAIVILYRQRLWAELRAIPASPAARSFWFGLFAAFVPIGIAGLALNKIMEKEFEGEVPIAIALIIGGV